MAGGRSRWWMFEQTVGLCWFALVARTRPHVRISPHLVALGLVLVLLGGVSVTSVSRVLVTWTGFYLLAGTLSLFADVMSRTIGLRTLVIAVDEEGS
jgi:hypothetical protein